MLTTITIPICLLVVDFRAQQIPHLNPKHVRLFNISLASLMMLLYNQSAENKKWWWAEPEACD